MSYPGYERLMILDTFAKIAGRQVYYHKGRDEYSIERDHNCLVQLTATEVVHLAGQFELEAVHHDVQDRLDDLGKEAER